MGKFQILLLLSIVTCAIISSVQSVPVKDSSVENDNSEKCKNLCGFCGCTAYYCGDECLCECNSQTDGEAECVNTMKSNCKKLELPFEVLIQGPNMNRMVRSLLYAEPKEEVCVKSSESEQDKRSTIRIYKPDVMEQQDEILSVPESYKVDVSKEDDPVAVVVAEKSSDSKTEADVKLEAIVDVVSNADMKPSSSERTNNKRHIIDVNQDIAENNSLYKRQADGAGTEDGDDVPAPAGDDVPAPAGDDTTGGEDEVGLAAPKAAQTVDVANIISGAIAKIKIPTDIEIKAEWDKYRKEVDTAIAAAIAVVVADAKKHAEELSKIALPVLKIDDLGIALVEPLKNEIFTAVAYDAFKKDVAAKLEVLKLKGLALKEAVKIGVVKDLVVPAAAAVVLGTTQDEQEEEIEVVAEERR